MNDVIKKDLDDFVMNFQLADFLNGRRILITGGTGLVGSTLVRCLMSLNMNIDITCPVRCIAKAKKIYGMEFNQIHFVESELLDYIRNLKKDDYFHYIVHCASPTSGEYMAQFPVETYTLAIDSTHELLKYALKAGVKDMVYISSIEYYGQILDDCTVTEDTLGFIDSMDTRSSYPLGKRSAEFLCTAYAKEYGINCKIARLTQTFGAGVSNDDCRVYAQFSRSIINGSDIILHTSGESAKPYCYTTDCVSAILYILLKGKRGEAYNVANEDTYISIRDMAFFLREQFRPSIQVIVEECSDKRYAPITKLHLSSEKLRQLGWKPQYDLKQMFERLILSLT